MGDSLFLFSGLNLKIHQSVLENKIEGLLLEKFKEEEYEDCFIVEIKLHANNKLAVFVDSDSAMDFRKCQRISRYLESFIDEKGWLGEKYVLEVSSPGIDRPLVFPRQYIKNLGRDFTLKLADGSEDEGTLIAADEEKITVEKKVRIKEGKRKRTQEVQTEYKYSDIHKALVKISFKKNKKK